MTPAVGTQLQPKCVVHKGLLPENPVAVRARSTTGKELRRSDRSQKMNSKQKTKRKQGKEVRREEKIWTQAATKP